MKKFNQVDAAEYTVRPIEVATLLVNLHLAAQHPLIGHGDHHDSLRSLTARLNRGVLKIKKGDLEAALWACNMLSELGEFWSPFIEKKKIVKEFDSFLGRISLPPGYKFDKFYNTIEDKRRVR